MEVGDEERDETREERHINFIRERDNDKKKKRERREGLGDKLERKSKAEDDYSRSQCSRMRVKLSAALRILFCDEEGMAPQQDSELYYGARSFLLSPRDPRVECLAQCIMFSCMVSEAVGGDWGKMDRCGRPATPVASKS